MYLQISISHFDTHTFQLYIRFAYMYATLCFFGGLFLTFLFDRALHAFEAWAGKRKAKKLTSSPSTRNVSPTLPWTSQDIEGQKQSSSSSSSVHSASNRGQDEAIEFVHDIGHDGQLVASLYEQQQEKSAQALIRMGIFAGIALAFHVRVLPAFEHLFFLLKTDHVVC